MDAIAELWNTLKLPERALSALELENTAHRLPSSYKIEELASISIALSSLTAALLSVRTTTSDVPGVRINTRHALAEFLSERLGSIDDCPLRPGWGRISGLYQTSDGHVRIHDNFVNHRNAALDCLGIDRSTPSKELVAEKCKCWKAVDLEAIALASGAVIFALRSVEEWDRLPQAKAVQDDPIELRCVASTSRIDAPLRWHIAGPGCLSGLRVVELSRVIAAPVAGRTLAAHGADVIWVTSPRLPSLPALDADMSRGKRHIELDLTLEHDRQILRRLIQGADVFLQGYRPGALAEKGFGFDDVAALHPGIVYANLSAWGPRGPWSRHRGFDSMVQTVSGMNVSEAEHAGEESFARVTPCQALDHAAGYFLAAGIQAALYRQISEGGSWEVSVSLAGVMKYLKSLGQLDGQRAFRPERPLDVGNLDDLMNVFDTTQGVHKALRHAGIVAGKVTVLKPYIGEATPEWLSD